METKSDIQTRTYKPPWQRELVRDAWAKAEQTLDLAWDLQALVDGGLIEVSVDGAGEACCKLAELGEAVASETDLMHNEEKEAL